MDEEKTEKRKIKVIKSGDEGEGVIEVKNIKKKPRERGNIKIVLLIFTIILVFTLFFKFWPVVNNFSFEFRQDEIKTDSKWEKF